MLEIETYIKNYFKNDIDINSKTKDDCDYDKKYVGYVKNSLKKK